MNVPRIRVRTLMFLVWLSALLCAGTVDVLSRKHYFGSRFKIIAVVGFSKPSLLWSKQYVGTCGFGCVLFSERYYYLGPILIGPYPTAVASGVAFAASVVAWALCRRSTTHGVAPWPAPPRGATIE